MVSDLISILVKEAMARVAAEHPDLDWRVESPAADRALNEFEEAWAAWKTDWHVRLADVRAAWKRYEHELLLANRVQLKLM